MNCIGGKLRKVKRHAKKAILGLLTIATLSVVKYLRIHAIETSAEGEKVILLWHARFWTSKHIDPSCGICEFTTDRRKIDDPKTAAVLFRSELIKKTDMPTTENRRSDQLYIWTSGEPPPALFHLRKIWLFWESKYGFNMTMSYRRDSSLYHPYGTVAEAFESASRNGYTKDLTVLLRRKRKLATAVISNCNSTAGSKARLDLLKNLLDAGLKAQYFGQCFESKKIPRGPAFDNLLSQYKFYLAFENSFRCRDYITEKFYRNSLNAGLVPVVWGPSKEDYEAVAPEHSFIHVEDFPSLSHLVNYLNYLDKNDTAYLEYFRWYLTNDLPLRDRDTTYCTLCQILHGGASPAPQDGHIYKQEQYFDKNPARFSNTSLYKWFYSQNHRDCLRTRLKFRKNETRVY